MENDKKIVVFQADSRAETITKISETLESFGLSIVPVEITENYVEYQIKVLK